MVRKIFWEMDRFFPGCEKFHGGSILFFNGHIGYFIKAQGKCNRFQLLENTGIHHPDQFRYKTWLLTATCVTYHLAN